MKTLLKILSIVTVVMIVLVGCGKAPQIGDKETKEYDNFKYVEAITLSEDDKNVDVVVPKGASTSSDGFGSGSSESVDMNISIVPSYDSGSAKTAKSIVMDDLKSAFDSTDYYDTKTSDIKTTDDDKKAKATTFTVKSTYDDKFESKCITTFCIEVEEDFFIKGQVEVSGAGGTDETEATVKELSDFYGINIYWNNNKIEEADKKYAENPPNIRRIQIGSYTASLPRNWDENTENSNYPMTVYTPSGKKYEGDRANIITMSNTTSVSLDMVEGASIKTIRKYIKNGFSADDIKLEQISSNIDGLSTYKGSLRIKNYRLTGYFIFEDYGIMSIATSSNGKPSKTNTKVVDEVYNSLSKGY